MHTFRAAVTLLKMRGVTLGVSKHTGARTAEEVLAFIMVPCMAYKMLRLAKI